MSVKRKIENMAEAATGAVEDIAKRVGLIQEYEITPDGKEHRVYYDRPKATARNRRIVTPSRPRITPKRPKLSRRRGKL